MQPGAKAPRPTGVTVLGVLTILIGLFGTLGGAALVMSPDTVVAGLSALAFVIGLLYIAAGIGFLQGHGWAWTLGILVSILSLIRNLAEVAVGAAVFGIPGIIVAVIVIYYLMTPKVKTFFGRGTKN